GRRRLIGRDGLPSSHSCGLNRMSAERTAVATRTSCWLRPVCSKVTTPSPGRLAEGRLAATTVAAYRVSPWNSGVGKVIFSKPRLATVVPWVSCATDSPTREARVNSEFTSGLPNGWLADQAASRCSDCGFMLSAEKNTL